MERYRIEHKTIYTYESPVSVAQQLVRLQPLVLPWQRCVSYRLLASPEPHSHVLEQDYFGNATRSLGFIGAHEALVLESLSEVEVFERPWAGALMSDSPAWESVRDSLSSNEEGLVAEYRFPSPLVPRFAPVMEFAKTSFTAHRPLLEACHDLMLRIYNSFEYAPGLTDSKSTVAEVWKTRKGVCQDFAHIMISALRGLGLAARYVSGYLRTDPPPGQPRLVGSDASHAWVAVWCPRWGWVEFDPTNKQLANTDYIVIAWGRDFTDVSPIRGVITGAAGHKLEVEVTVWPELKEVAPMFLARDLVR